MSNRTGEMLAAYFDLRSDRGPVHARIVSLMGRRLARGGPIPACQTVTPSGLRWAIFRDAPDLPMIDDPRTLPPARRSPEWACLCELVDHWDDLPLPDRLRVARVLHKLGLWGAIRRLTPPPSADTGAGRTLTRLRRLAVLKSRGEDDLLLPPDMYEIYASVARDPDAPPEERISAAVNLALFHGRHDRTPDEIAPWAGLARQLLDAGSPTPLLASAAWRAICFLPYYRHDHLAVAAMLNEAERLGLAALEAGDSDAGDPGSRGPHAGDPAPRDPRARGPYAGRPNANEPDTRGPFAGGPEALGPDPGDPGNRLIAVENLRVLYQTRGRAARDRLTAEQYYRRAVDLDPEDPQTHVTLGDHLLHAGRHEEAYESFATAADLGAPYTGYALSRMNACRRA